MSIKQWIDDWLQASHQRQVSAWQRKLAETEAALASHDYVWRTSGVAYPSSRGELCSEIAGLKHRLAEAQFPTPPSVRRTT